MLTVHIWLPNNLLNLQPRDPHRVSVLVSLLLALTFALFFPERVWFIVSVGTGYSFSLVLDIYYVILHLNA